MTDRLTEARVREMLALFDDIPGTEVAELCRSWLAMREAVEDMECASCGYAIWDEDGGCTSCSTIRKALGLAPSDGDTR